MIDSHQDNEGRTEMHAAEREREIMELLEQRGFLAFRELTRSVNASPATLRRDLDRMASAGRISRVRGGAHLSKQPAHARAAPRLLGVPFQENIGRHRTEKEAIGRAAASLCVHGEGVMIDGGSTTLQMCPNLEGLNLQVLTNSLHIVGALLPQAGTRILIPGGALFREQNIVLSPTGDHLVPPFHAPKLFMGAAAVGSQGVMQDDIVLVAGERQLIERAEALILLVDSSKFSGSSGHVVCSLRELDVVVTDRGIDRRHVAMLQAAEVNVVIAQ